MTLKTQLGWMRNGAERTTAQFATLAAELRDLQTKVEALTTVVARLDGQLGRVDSDGTRAIGAMRAQVRAVTDDLGDRLGALSERVESISAR